MPVGVCKTESVWVRKNVVGLRRQKCRHVRQAVIALRMRLRWRMRRRMANPTDVCLDRWTTAVDQP